jgi:hypothetical protein
LRFPICQHRQTAVSTDLEHINNILERVINFL